MKVILPWKTTVSDSRVGLASRSSSLSSIVAVRSPGLAETGLAAREYASSSRMRTTKGRPLGGEEPDISMAEYRWPNINVCIYLVKGNQKVRSLYGQGVRSGGPAEIRTRVTSTPSWKDAKLPHGPVGRTKRPIR